jgi:hypothetical protein
VIYTTFRNERRGQVGGFLPLCLVGPGTGYLDSFFWFSSVSRGESRDSRLPAVSPRLPLRFGRETSPKFRMYSGIHVSRGTR